MVSSDLIERTDVAFRWLDRAYAQKDTLLWAIKSDRLLTPLRDNPRYKSLPLKMNLLETSRCPSRSRVPLQTST